MHHAAANPPADVLALRRTSHILAAACGLLVWALPLAVLACWALADVSTLASQAHLAPGAIQGALTPLQRVAGALLTCVPVGLLLRGLWTARQCFQGFARGHVFTPQAVQGLRHFAAWVMASVVAGMLLVPALSVLLTLNNPPGMRHLAIALGSDHIFTLLFAGVVWLMAAIIGQGQALAEENAAFV
ncbi:MAG: DUF2975 domain-containing protein [Rhodoferax sp.]|uniref:DUF2975 domain-containing protein n=1 Tax=Rhodoferax sp. TaxID=50421 RepID=UPI0032664757